MSQAAQAAASQAAADDRPKLSARLLAALRLGTWQWWRGGWRASMGKMHARNSPAKTAIQTRFLRQDSVHWKWQAGF